MKLTLPTLFLILTILCSGLACKKDSAETQIKNMLTESVEFANTRAIGDLMDNVSDSFVGPYAMGKKDAKRYIFAKLYKKDWHRVLIYESVIELIDVSNAKVQIKVALARGDNIERLEDLKTKTNYDAFRLELIVKNNDDRWLVEKAEHKRLGPEEIF